MIAEPSQGRLLEGVVETLEASVLPELERGSSPRRQLHAAIDILRRLAFAEPLLAAGIDAENEDMARTLRDLNRWTNPTKASALNTALNKAEAEGDRSARRAILMDTVTEIQSHIEGFARDADAAPELERLLRGLYRRMIDRELALLPPSRHGAKP